MKDRREDRRARWARLGILLALCLLASPPGPVSSSIGEGVAGRSEVRPAGLGRSVDQGIVITGIPAPGLVSFDGVMALLLLQYHIPGGALAVAKDGRLVLSHGYGLSDVDAGEVVLPNSLFRIASVSKPITAVAVLTLVDQGLLSLDDKPFRILDQLQPPPNAAIDPRLYDITIKDLLQHAGGWDSGKSFDPQYQPWNWQEAGVLGVQAPPSATDIVRFMLGQPLDFAPGSRTVYSNFGYNVLGRVIEKVSGMSYEQYVQTRVLAPAGIADMRLGRTRLEDRAPGEVRYYSPPSQGPVPSVYPGQGFVQQAYGSFSMEALDAHGGWIATAADLARFATAIDGQRGPALLKPETVQAMLYAPIPSVTNEGDAGAGNERSASGLSWIVQPAGGGVDWSHAGALEGSNASWLIRTHDGLTIAFVANSLPKNFGDFFTDATTLLKQVAGNVSAWPEGDQFSGP